MSQLSIILEVIVQSKLRCQRGAIQIETIFRVVHAMVVLCESETEGGSPVFSSHPSHARTQTDSPTIVVDNAEVASEIHENAEFLNRHEVAAQIGFQDQFVLGIEVFHLHKGIIHFGGNGQRRASEAVTDFRGDCERSAVLGNASADGTTNPQLSVCTNDANEGKS